MIIKPRRDDFLVIGLATGRVIVGVGLLFLVPLMTSVAYAEWNSAVDLLIGIGVCLVAGLTLMILCQTTRELTWSHGLVSAGLSWLLATVLAALPYWLSGHFGSYLDCVFDIMSGFTTTGLYLLQDLDHVSQGLNMWRHLLTYAGGQGIVVIALTFLFRGSAGAYTIYVGEGKDERLLPNVVRTARAIWIVSLTYLGLGTAALFAVALGLGQRIDRALLHALWVFMGGWSTGGFAPQSYNTLYYHSLALRSGHRGRLRHRLVQLRPPLDRLDARPERDPQEHRNRLVLRHDDPDHVDGHRRADEAGGLPRRDGRSSARCSTRWPAGTPPPASPPSTAAPSSASGAPWRCPA